MKSTALRNTALGFLSVLFVFSAVYGFSGWQGVENANDGEALTHTIWNSLVDGVVKKTGDVAETITGIKTFSVSPVVPSPTASGEVASKGYVDSTTGGAGATKNYIINGNFDIWQRGTSFIGVNATSLTYFIDRWFVIAPGTANITRESFSPGQTSVSDNSSYYVKISATSAGSYFGQKIEDVRLFSDKTFTISFYAKASSATNLSNFSLLQHFGAGGSSRVYDNLGNLPLTTSWQKFTRTFSLPSISGKTIGTDDYGEFSFQIPTGIDISLARFQLEKGDNATNFEYRNIGEELTLAQRYFQKFDAITQRHTTYSSSIVGGSISLLQQMRTTPTIATTSINYYQSTHSLVIDYITKQSFAVYYTTGSAGYSSLDFAITANAELY